MPDYTNSITNLSNSILKRFGVKPFHNSIDEIDKLIEGKKKIVVFLFDGLGEALVDKHLPEDSYLRLNLVHRMTSTFPPTTVAATTSFRTGKFPIETGWLSWTQYFEDIDKNVNVFPNVDSLTGEKISPEDILFKKVPYKTIMDLINEENGKPIASEILDHHVDCSSPRFMSGLIKKAYKKVHEQDEGFVYAYCTKPDSVIHEHGVDSKFTKWTIEKINRLIVRYQTMPINHDVTTIIIADHGLINVQYHEISVEHPDLYEMLIRPISFEMRASNFYVKDKYKEEFPILFKKYYGEHYAIYSKKQVLEYGIFGQAEGSEIAKSFIGDYVAIATDGFTITDRAKHKLIGHHAGSTEDEYNIDVFLFPEREVNLQTKWPKKPKVQIISKDEDK